MSDTLTSPVSTNVSSKSRPHLINRKDLATEYTLPVSVSWVIRSLFLVFLFLLAMNLYVVYGYQMGGDFLDKRMFYFDNENNFPTFFNVFILGTAAFILLAIALVKRGAKDAYARHWGFLAFAFFALTLDEQFSFHEKLIDPLRIMLNLTGFLRFAWVVPGVVAVLFFVSFYVKFLLHLPAFFRVRFFVSGLLYVLGAIGMEMVGGYLYEHTAYGERSLLYMVAMTLEESLEMAGILAFIHTLLLYLRTFLPEVKFTIK